MPQAGHRCLGPAGGAKEGVGLVGVGEDDAERLVCNEQPEFSRTGWRVRVGRQRLCSVGSGFGFLWLYSLLLLSVCWAPEYLGPVSQSRME